jgi:hypothetical protein
MIHPNASDTFTVRSVFVIGPDKKVKLMITYPASTGRNFDEILRVIDSLQLTAKYSVATPVNWKDGDDVIIVPAVSDEDAKQKFPGGWKTLKPYLRIVPQPGKAKRAERRLNKQLDIRLAGASLLGRPSLSVEPANEWGRPHE